MSGNYLARFALSAALSAVSLQALGYNVIDRTRPQSVQLLQLQPPLSKLIELDADTRSSTHKMEDLDKGIASYVKLEDCASIVKSVDSRDYETAEPETLASIATCEPPGKDPEKLFTFAEKKMPSSDMILLLHARYSMKRNQLAHAMELLQQLYAQTKNPHLSQLASEYLPAPARPAQAATGYTYVATAQLGGIEEANPQGVPISSPNFGNNVSTAGVAQLAATVRKPFGDYSYGVDNVISDTTYWLTHSFDMLTEDVDLSIERKLGESQKIGLRPFASFYLMAGARYYTAAGLGLTYATSSQLSDQWMQLSSYQDVFWLKGETNQSATHERVDWQIYLKQFPTLAPAVQAYIDLATAGSVDTTGGNHIPYSHTEYGLAAAFNRFVHRYSVGLSLRMAYRLDAQQTILITPQGTTVAKTRNDFQFVIRPNLTIPLMKGLDLFMYFESNSIASNIIPSDGLDRNISDNLIGAVLRASVANF